MFFSKVVENIKLNDRLFLKPEYLNHEFVSGNKWRKLKYNIEKAKNEGHTTLLSFGGAYSNHIAALASAGKIYGFKTIGVIRGEELESNYENNPTLKYAKSCGMIFKFVSRESYKMKDALHFINDLRNQFGAFMLIPEGGTNKLAIKGCEEIFNPTDIMFDYVCCCVGTGGTISGLINSCWPHQKILGFQIASMEGLKQGPPFLLRVSPGNYLNLFPADTAEPSPAPDHNTLAMRRSASSVPSQQMTMPECWEKPMPTPPP